MTAWNDILPGEAKKIANQLSRRAEEDRQKGKTVYPPQNQIFRALELVKPEQVKVVIVGQDPYHEEGQANGLAFSVAPGNPLPPSLKNIFKELVSDINCNYPSCGDLTPWAEQGVLLLNTVLTVEQGQANSHKNWGWQEFTSAVFNTCAALPQPIVFILWGGQARAFVAGAQLQNRPNKAQIWSSHPSPLGAMKRNEAIPAFIGSKPFSTANHYLMAMEAEPIDWVLP